MICWSARAKTFLRALTWCWKNFGEKILLLRQNATTPHNFTYQKICCFLLLQQKNVAKKFFNNIEKNLVWHFFSKIESGSWICKKQFWILGGVKMTMNYGYASYAIFSTRLENVSEQTRHFERLVLSFKGNQFLS